MDIQAHELLNRREWTKAAELYNQLLRNKDIHLQECITYLLGRSECFYNLGQYEAVVADCRTIINLLIEEIDVEGETIARKRLVYALFQLRRFAGIYYCYYKHFKFLICTCVNFRCRIGYKRMGCTKGKVKFRHGGQNAIRKITCQLSKYN